MKTKLIAQEILIVYTVFKNQPLENNENQSDHTNPQKRLAEVSRQGLLTDIIPNNFPKLPLREINETYTFLELKYGDFNSSFDDHLSINPYIFYQKKSEN